MVWVWQNVYFVVQSVCCLFFALRSNVRSVAWIRFEDGSEESITPDKFEVIG